MRFLFYVPCSTVVRGGISVIFEIIDVLNTNGVEAAALYDRPDFEYDRYVVKAPRVWSSRVKQPKDEISIRTAIKSILDLDLRFSSRVPNNAELCPEWSIEPNDVLVVPEYVSDWMPDKLPQDLPLILFNQNPFALFRASIRAGFKPAKFFGSLSISQACSSGTNMILANKPVRIPLFISEELYAFQKEKLFQVAYMPRKRHEDSRVLIKALKSTPGLENIRFVPIDGVSSSDAARILRDSLFFLSFSQREGFGLPAAEAMATGALVIGYSGIGGDEFFNEETGFLISEDNLMEFYNVTVSVIQEYIADVRELDIRREQASKKIFREYSKAKFDDRVVQAFSEFENAVKE